jgi:protein-L-isoaspartate(D-aspartate) O-methyltransferase
MGTELYHIRSMIAAIREYGCRNERVLDAMLSTPRHLFAPEGLPLDQAYGDYPIVIGEQRTISQPYTVAFMLDLLDPRPGNAVLEIGTGSGWNAALLKHMIGRRGRVTTVEIDERCALSAASLLRELAIDVEVRAGDGSAGYAPNAPYDRIIATCAVPVVFDAWMKQLGTGGIIVAPVGRGVQDMIRVVKGRDRITTERHGSFQFVAMRS